MNRFQARASVTAGTVFHRTRVPLRIWFLGIFFLARHKQGISALQFQRDTGLGSYQTAWTLLHKLRSALWHRPEQRLRGWVEADETYVGAEQEKGLRGWPSWSATHRTLLPDARARLAQVCLAQCSLNGQTPRR